MNSKISRRKFMATSTATALGTGLAAHPFAIFADGAPARKITVAIMGIRSRGNALATAFASQPDCEIAYLCDVDSRYFENTLKAIEPLQKRKPKLEKDIRKVLEDKDVDALVIAAPDHWHAPAAIMACQAGKHVYVEKPCSHNPKEGELLVQAARKYQRVVQMGNQRRSWPNVMAGIQDLQAGVIGRVYYARGWYTNTRESIGFGKTTAAPDYLDFDLWQGPAPRKPYQDNLHPYNWHWFWHWGTGESLNNGTHFLDLMRWGLGVNYPSRVVSTGGRYHFKDDWQTPDTQIISLDFEEEKSISWESRSCNSFPLNGTSAGVIFHGEGGTMIIPSGNEYAVYDNSRAAKLIKKVDESAKENNRPDAQNTVGPGEWFDGLHVLNFLQSIREGERLHSEIEEGHKSVLLCQLGNIAYRTGRALNIDQRNGHIIGDPEAMNLWSRTYEPGWEINV
ncbi:MAG: Gfo/Idh/MocA family oxidoreductase [Saprospiraceae bacterium]